jgi:hypothetical protein
VAALAIALELSSKVQAQQVDTPSTPSAPQDRPVLASPLPEIQGWRFVGVPKQPPTRFARVESDGAPALRIETSASYGNLVHDFAAPVAPGVLAWQWRVDAANAAADLAQRDGDDTNIKVCALFDMPIERVPFVERQLLRLARSVSGEPLPAATVCYVWDPKRTADSALSNAYSPRVRYLVLRGDEAPLMQWVGEQRDLATDFRRLFGHESAQVPMLAALAVGADADNTRGRSVALLRGLRWAGPLAR